MSCCGSRRADARAVEARLSASPAPSVETRTEARAFVIQAVDFEYIGPGQITVIGPLTGAVYRFGASAGPVRVQGSDAPSLLSIPGLRVVR